MKIVVDKNLCTGCGICVEMCPEVFFFSGAIAEAIEGEVPLELQTQAGETVYSCPVEAIEIIEN